MKYWHFMQFHIAILLATLEVPIVNLEDFEEQECYKEI